MTEQLNDLVIQLHTLLQQSIDEADKLRAVEAVVCFTSNSTETNLASPIMTWDWNTCPEYLKSAIDDDVGVAWVTLVPKGQSVPGWAYSPDHGTGNTVLYTLETGSIVCVGHDL